MKLLSLRSYKTSLYDLSVVAGFHCYLDIGRLLHWCRWRSSTYILPRPPRPLCTRCHTPSLYHPSHHPHWTAYSWIWDEILVFECEREKTKPPVGDTSPLFITGGFSTPIGTSWSRIKCKSINASKVCKTHIWRYFVIVIFNKLILPDRLSLLVYIYPSQFRLR